MSDRIHQALDGELPIADLAPDECRELHQYRRAICAALPPIQWSSIDVSARVRARTHPSSAHHRLRALGQAIWSSRSLSIRPVYGIAAALMLAVAVWRSHSGGAQRILVQFRMSAQDAHQVALVGDFNGWRPEHRLHRSADGVWSIDVSLEPGVYNYVFVVDGGTVRLDPLAPRVTDGFGGQSSRVAVLMPSRRS